MRPGVATRRRVVFTLPARLVENDLPEVCFEFLLKDHPHPRNIPLPSPCLAHTHTLPRAQLTQRDCLCADFSEVLLPDYLSVYSGSGTVQGAGDMGPVALSL